MKRARHERVVFDGIRETDEFCAGKAEAIPCALGGFLDQSTYPRDGIHVDARAGGRNVHRSTKTFSRGQRFWNRIQKIALVSCESLMNQRRVAAHKIYADVSGCFIDGPA